MEPRIAAAAHSAVEPLGVHAQAIDVMWETMLWVCGAMYFIVLAFLLVALLRRRRAESATAESAQGRRLSIVLGAWVALITVGLFGLTLASFLTDRALVRAAAEPQVNIKVTAHQWWWEVEYQDGPPSERFRTANELHIPVDVPVHVQLASNDVIHSFWIPNLHGKRDVIPARANEIRLQGTATGLLRGECAEYCGMQHAFMPFDVFVDSQDDYRRWRARQLATASPPNDPREQRGLDLFMSGACSACHAISGTPAFGTVGPDLSHFGSRRMIAGVRLNTPQNLQDWLANPQRIKPGVRMPAVSLSQADRDALVAYLGSLR